MKTFEFWYRVDGVNHYVSVCEYSYVAALGIFWSYIEPGSHAILISCAEYPCQC